VKQVGYDAKKPLNPELQKELLEKEAVEKKVGEKKAGA
jgi:hypothetical protein